MVKKAVAVKDESFIAEAAGAVRTCIGCRKVAARDQLIRLVRSAQVTGETVATVDLKGRMPGRGAWLHPQAECWQLAIKRRAIGRALPGILNAEAVELFATEGLPLANPVIRT